MIMRNSSNCKASLRAPIVSLRTTITKASLRALIIKASLRAVPHSSFIINKASLRALLHSSFIIFAFIITLTHSVRSQDLYLPPLPELEATLTTFIEIERDAKLRAFDELKSSDWTEALPSVGIAYTPAGDPRPSASWSPLQILDRRDQKKKRKMDRESIYLTYEILMTDRLYKLRQLYQDFIIDLDALALKQSTIEIDEKLYAIDIKKYEENIIKPSEFLQAKKTILLIRADIKRMEQELLKRKHEVLYEAKWN
jgi:hypothetical protein